jgi:integrase
LFNFAIDNDYLDKNPAQKLKKFREEKREMYLSKEEVERLFTALGQSEHKIQASLMKLIIFTGSRSGEVKNICWSEVDLEKGVWMRHASKVKGKKTVSVPFNQMALAVLKEMQDYRKEGVDYIFINPKTHKPFESNKTFWKTLCKKLNLKNVRIHDLRHTFASLLINNNINLEIVSKLLGHSDVKITQRYAHLNTNSLQTATNMIDEIFRKKD